MSMQSYGGYGRPPTDQRSAGVALLVVAWLLALLTLCYLLPWAVAVTRGRSNQAAIGLVNLFLGWTFIGWVVALVMACQAHQVGGVQQVLLVAPPYAGPPVPGWYPSPDGSGQRYWDGTAWTEHRAP